MPARTRRNGDQLLFRKTAEKRHHSLRGNGIRLEFKLRLIRFRDSEKLRHHGEIFTDRMAEPIAGIQPPLVKNSGSPLPGNSGPRDNARFGKTGNHRAAEKPLKVNDTIVTGFPDTGKQF